LKGSFEFEFLHISVAEGIIGYWRYENYKKRTLKPSGYFMKDPQWIIDMAQNLHLLLVLI
jgi:hypothetical protein